MSKSMWTRTTTLLPNKGDPVLVCFIGEKSSRVIRIAFYDQPMLGCDQYPFDGCVEDEYGEMLCPLGFYEMESYYDDEPKNYRIDNVTHWQPLPPLPEE